MLVQINKKLYVGFMIIIFSIFSYFLMEVNKFNKKSDLYSRQNIFQSKVNFNPQKFYFLDGYSLLLDFKTIPYCDLVNFHTLIVFKKIAERYPEPLTISKYWSFSQKKHMNIEHANNLRHAYALLSKNDEKVLKAKKCI